MDERAGEARDPLAPGRSRRWLFWTLDEASALLGPALLGLAANAFVTGLLPVLRVGPCCAGPSGAAART